MKKTNAMRMLDGAKISYEVVEYDVDPEDLSGLHTAQLASLPPQQVFKTIVLKGDRGGYLVVCVPVEDEIDLKKVAALSGDKAVELISVSELEKITGYVRGGCSPIGMKKKFPTFASEKLRQQEKVYVSAGRRGLQLCLSSADLISFCGISLGDIVRT
jgi:Cys-tRNA(Pro)/Cys-tRNA(Cys) deacylase